MKIPFRNKDAKAQLIEAQHQILNTLDAAVVDVEATENAADKIIKIEAILKSVDEADKAVRTNIENKVNKLDKALLVPTFGTLVGVTAATLPVLGPFSIVAGMAAFFGFGLTGIAAEDQTRKRGIKTNQDYLNELKKIGAQANDSLRLAIEEGSLVDIKKSEHREGLLYRYDTLRNRFAEVALIDGQPRVIDKPRAKPVDPKI